MGNQMLHHGNIAFFRLLREHPCRLVDQHDLLIFIENIQLFKELVGAFGRDADDGKVPAVFAGETALLGKDEIEEKLPELLEKGEAPYAIIEEKLENLGEGEAVTAASLATLFGAGLLAGKSRKRI